MASGKSSSVTLQPLLPDRAYKVAVSAVHYTGESESTTATGRTGECIHQHMQLHQLSSIRLGVTSPGKALPFLRWAVAVAKVLLSKLQKAWKRENPAPVSARPMYNSRMNEKGWWPYESWAKCHCSEQQSSHTLLSLPAPVMSKLPSIRGFVPSKTEGKSSPIMSGISILFFSSNK